MHITYNYIGVIYNNFVYYLEYLYYMASQKLTSIDDDPQILVINSYVRGYHAYMETWNPSLGQGIILKPEPSNY